METEKLPYDSMQARLDRAGVETIYSESGKPNETKLRYNGKTVLRGYAINCEYLCKKAFNIGI